MRDQVAQEHYIAADLFGDEQFANMIMVGAAFQLGAISIAAGAIERAIELNGVASLQNIQAFRQGRRTVLKPDPDRPATAGRPPKNLQLIRRQVPAAGELGRILNIRVPELIAYQNRAYARGYARFVEQASSTEQKSLPGSTAITEAVARQLFKLMAYKDEYEVARLILDTSFAERIADDFGSARKVKVRLHPPVLRALGMRKKIALGSWSRPMFVVLYRSRRLRGTPLDPFGHAEVRQVERALITEYTQAVEAALETLTVHNRPAVLRLAELPDLVRGYEDIKLRNVETFRDELAASLGRLQPQA